jgi:hypothetical protein
VTVSSKKACPQVGDGTQRNQVFGSDPNPATSARGVEAKPMECTEARARARPAFDTSRERRAKPKVAERVPQ